jgi:FKBP-type peptidyl-prolyl cis-trans isomerase SlyD
MDRIGPNARVLLDYTLRDGEGDVIDASDADDQGEPIVYVHGYGMIVPGLERALVGLKEGDSKDVTVPPEEGYGERDEELIVEVARSEMPRPDAVAVGDEIVAESPDGDEAVLTVIEIDGDTIILDGNHPLAGETLRYSVIIRSVRQATDDEIKEAAKSFEEAQAEAEAPEETHEHDSLVQLRRGPKSLPN